MPYRIKERLKPTSKGRPRSEGASEAIFASAWSLLEESGYQRLSMEAIAARAGVGKATIYRRWQSKAYLVLDMYCRAEYQIPVAARGNVRQDLSSFLRRTFRALTETSSGASMVSLMAEAQIDPAFAKQMRERFIAQRRAALRSLLEAAVQRKELRDGIDFETAVDTIYGAMWYRLLNRHSPLSTHFVESLVKQTCEGLCRGSRTAR